MEVDTKDAMDVVDEDTKVQTIKGAKAKEAEMRTGARGAFPEARALAKVRHDHVSERATTKTFKTRMFLYRRCESLRHF